MLAQQGPAFTPVCLSGAICGWEHFAERQLPNRTSLCEAAFSLSTPRALHIDPINNWLGLKHHCTITCFAVAVITHLWAIRLVCWPCFCSPDKKKVAQGTTRHQYLLLSPHEPGLEKRIELVVIVQISVKKACPLCLCVHVCLMALRSLSAAAVVVHPETHGQCV